MNQQLASFGVELGGAGQTCIWPGFGVEMQSASAGINQQAELAVMVGVRQESS